MRYLSICSGIEAASVAWHPLGWRPLAFSEIEAFPRAVLKHHYPDVPLHGDFTQLRDQPFIVDADLLVGGTPCQAFSIAGLRQSLSDDRGNLSLEFIRLADAIDDLRRDAGREPAYILWENVPGVFSTGDNAFGAFLGGLVGSDAPIVPRGRWQDAGVVAGPERVAAWRVLDAQYFGLAQRRKRVFVLARKHPRGWACADALLPLIDSLSGHPAPRRETGKSAPTLPSRSSAGGGLGADFDCDGGLVAFGSKEHAQDAGRVSPPLRAMGSNKDHPNGGGQVAIAYSIMPQNSGKDYKAREVDVAQPLMAAGPVGGDQGGDYIVQPVTFAIQAGALRENPDAGPDGVGVQADQAYTLEARAEVQAIAFAVRTNQTGQNGPGYMADLAPSLSADETPSAIAFALRGREDGAMPEAHEHVSALRAASGGSSRDYIAFDTTQVTSAANRSNPKEGDPCHPLAAGAHPPAIAGSAVRRLTPGECEKLQGFPVGYTNIPWRGQPESPDGPRYKALGNSMATPCMAYIASRIIAVEASSTEAAA